MPVEILKTAGRMPFLSSNQQRQSIEGTINQAISRLFKVGPVPNIRFVFASVPIGE